MTLAGAGAGLESGEGPEAPACRRVCPGGTCHMDTGGRDIPAARKRST